MLAPPRSLPPGRESVMAVLGRLGSIQFDPLEVAGRNHDLVLLSRVAGYRREMADALLYDERRLFEAYNKGLSLLPTLELPWFRQTWDRYRESHESGTFKEHAALVDEILTRIRAEGPLSSIDFETRASIDWYWRPTNQVRAVLEALAMSGLLGFARRQGNRRYYDLVERLFPAELMANRPDPWQQRRHRLLSRYRAHGLLGRAGQAELWLNTAPAKRVAGYDGPLRGELLDDMIAAGDLVPVKMDGVRGDRFVLAEEMGLLDTAERDVTAAGARDQGDWTPLDPSAAGVALLAPLDPFVWDREFLRSLYGFDYIWEVYVPEEKRRWGYYVLPILWGDRLVGRIEPRIDRPADVLRILNVFWEPGFDPVAQPPFINAFGEALEAHRAFAGVGRVELPRTAARSALRSALAAVMPVSGARASRLAGATRGRRPVGVGR